MDQALLKEQLTQVESHVARGEQHITRQRQLIAELQDGHDTALATALLDTFLQTQDSHVAIREQLRVELSGAGS